MFKLPLTGSMCEQPVRVEVRTAYPSRCSSCQSESIRPVRCSRAAAFAPGRSPPGPRHVPHAGLGPARGAISGLLPLDVRRIPRRREGAEMRVCPKKARRGLARTAAPWRGVFRIPETDPDSWPSQLSESWRAVRARSGMHVLWAARGGPGLALRDRTARDRAARDMLQPGTGPPATCSSQGQGRHRHAPARDRAASDMLQPGTGPPGTGAGGRRTWGCTCMET